MKRVKRHIIRVLTLLLLFTAAAHQAWATDVTYHILTLPIDNTIYHMTSAFEGKRLEAVKVVVTGQSTLELPAHYKSPLATGFTYYAISDPNITKSGSAVKLFDATNNSNKAYWYNIGGSATPVAEGTPLSGQSAEYYVVYTYNSSNTIAQLNGSVHYNIKTIGYDNKGNVKEKGFVAYNRGRNNRPAVLPKDKVGAEILASKDFRKVDVSGTNVSPYWKDGNNKNKESLTSSKFHFIFKFEGLDPYNIIIRTAYAKDTTYIEKNDNSEEFVYKYYKEGSLFGNGAANTYIASDEHQHYNMLYDSSLPDNPTTLTPGAAGTHTGYDARNGYYHGQKGTLWNSFALLNNSKSTGYVFMATRTLGGDGAPPATPYYLIEANSCNNLVMNQKSTSDATNNLTIEGLYPIKTVTFKVKTSFYGTDGDDDAHTVSATANISQYTIDNDPIDEKFIPEGLRRKYCNFTTTYRNSDGDVITKYSDMKSDGVIYLEYVVYESIPFKAITPAASYDADTWKAATWYELTDDGSTQADGKKLEFNSPYFMNNGDAGDYRKISEYAFIGDPYELQVVYRDATSGASPVYVGAASVSTGTPLTTSTTASAGYIWEMPDDAAAGSFILRNYKDANKGCWRWNTDHISQAISYATKSGQTVNAANSEAQTVTLTITGFAGGDGNYFKMTAAGDNPDQIDSSDPVLSTGMGGIIGTEGTATVTLKSSGGVAKSFTLSIQEYNLSNVAQGEACVITITQGTDPYTGNNVEYSTAGSTRVRVMELPERDFTFNIVDKAGNIAIKATVSKTIFSPLNGYASIPEVIRSPFLSDETVTFYDSYTDRNEDDQINRKDWNADPEHTPDPIDAQPTISELPNTNHDIYVKYTTTKLNDKSIHLNADEEKQKFNVKLNGSYIYYDGGVIKSKDNPTTDELATNPYIWCLRNRDPYNMLIDNIAARASSDEEPVTIYDDDGGTAAGSKVVGGWVKVADGSWGDDKALGFTPTRTDASRFIAMMSNYVGIYEVMAATGDDTYYHIGRTTDTKIYSVNTTGYAHGDDALRFELFGKNPIIYTLIDKAGNELLDVTSNNPRLTLPAEFVSPLVDTYYYYPTKALAEDDVTSGNHTGNITEPDQITDENNKVWVTYTVNDLIGFNNSGRIDDHPYLLKFLQPFAEGYYLEDGNDKLTSTKLQAIYPYCNGDGTLNIYGEKMRDEQMGGGSSTRSRWVWFFESSNNDPYHVKIHSRNTIAYNSVNYPTYLQTSVVQFKQDPGTNRIVTGGALPGIAAGTGTEYMILGVEGQYRLKTTNEIEGARRDIRSLEQYWKTYNMVKLYVLGISAETDAFSNDPTTWVVPDELRDDLKSELEKLKYTATDASNLTTQINALTSTGIYYFRVGTDPESYTYKKVTVTNIPASALDTDYTIENCSEADWKGPNYVDGWVWHSYDEYVYATRWNGFNDKEDGHTKKVVEKQKLEHWYQTFDMGNGTFDVETAIIPPVLVLLDRHGWEIMRKPLPDKSMYPSSDVTKLNALKAYDSPLVKEYKFYSNATKASGCHKYTLRLDDKTKLERDQIKLNGVQYKSSSLAELPPLEASGVLSNGVLNDQYVTYTVKEEYEDNFDYNLTLNEGDHTFTETGESQPYLVLQNARFYKTPNSDNTSYLSKPIFEHTNPVGGNVFDLIVSPQNNTVNIIDGSDNFIGNNFWRVMPNLDIDDEMGIPWGTENDTTKAEPLSKYGTRVKYEKKTDFDPYNIQLQLVNKDDGTADGRYLTAHMTSTSIVNGAMKGDYTGGGGTVKITLEAKCDATNPEDTKLVHSEGYDHTTMNITNQTFMAVSDANDNLQLMPRFDHSLRVDLANSNPWETHLKAPKDNKKASADDNSSMGSQTTFFVRPQRIHYHIIDNMGREALPYKRGGDFEPAITDHFKSPLAKDFTFYTGLAEFEYPDPEDPENPIAESTEGAWAAAGEFKRTATTVDLMNSLINLLPTAGTYEYRVGTRGAFTYYSVVVTKGLSEKEITGSFGAAGLKDVDNDVYVRYNYNEEADHDADKILQGQWFTVKLSEKDLQAEGEVVINDDPETPAEESGTGVDLYAGADDSRSLTAADATEYATKRDALPQTGDYYFKIGIEAPYTYKKVNVTTVPIGSASDYTETTDDGTLGYDTKWSNSKPLVVDSDGKKWQWKFLAAPTDPSSDYYVEPDPYAVQLFNRHSNYTINPSAVPSPMSVGIKVPNADNGADRFALLSHPDGGYALAVAKTYPDYNYLFINGTSMTTSVAATTAQESNFTYNSDDISDYAQVLLNNDVTHNFEYQVINNSSKLAVSANQTTEEAEHHEYSPYLPEAIQTPLLNMEDYEYYGFARRDTKETPDPSDDTYEVIPQTILYTLAGLYDDKVWVRYGDYNMNRTPFKVPNKRNSTSEDPVARADDSQDASLNIDEGLPYNIIWYDDEMMKAVDSEPTDGVYDAIGSDADKDLSGNSEYIWYFKGNDPYALKIKHKSGKYVNGTTMMVDEASAPTFMLLRKSGYDYGILQLTGTTGADAGKKLTGFGGALTADASTDPNKFIIFGLSVHDLIYRLIIARTCTDSEKTSPAADQYVDIPCKGETDNTKRIFGTTQRDLSTATYQLGETINVYDGSTTTAYNYCVDAGAVSIGDLLQVPNEFNRPNCTFEFYIDGVWNSYDSETKTISDANDALNTQYKGEKLNVESPRLMSDASLINTVVRVNIVYSFNQELATNNGMDFVKSVDQNLWYTYETKNGDTPYLAQYTNAWGLQAKAGRATRYTNDYLWTPLGDVYGFKMYNRYMLKNSGGIENVMTMNNIAEGKNLYLAVPGTTVRPESEGGGVIPVEYGIFELVSGDEDGYFRVHPVANTKEQTQYYVRRDPSDNYAKLSTTPCDWTYGLDMTLLEPYYERAGYVGGLTDPGKAAYDAAVATGKITEIQNVVYNDDYIVSYTPGYYRLHSQPGVSGVSPVRYASGYLHETEKTAVSGGIPMHFYSKAGVTGTFDGDTNPLESGFTETPATRGDIPIPATEDDPSTIFYIPGGINPEDLTDTHNPRVTMQTQGLYVAANANGDTDYGKKEGKTQRAVMSDDANDAITFSLMDIGGAVLLIHDGATPAQRRYLNFDQSVADSIYDLRYYHESPTDDAKWCMQPVQKTSTAGDGEMPLNISTNNGGDGYYYTTFYAPYDVLLPGDDGGKTYNAYYCKKWRVDGVNPVPVPAYSSYDEGKFVPAGTPVIIRTNDDSESVTLTLPRITPSASPVSGNIFNGQYLEQLLGADKDHDVYTLGLPFTTSVTIDRNTGNIDAPVPEQASNGLGFYINATLNKEVSAMNSSWTRNNRYVIHNKIYYRETGAGARANFVPLLFDDPLIDDKFFDPEEPPVINDPTVPTPVLVGDVYDLMGRRVATAQQVLDGTWKLYLPSGVYIIGGKKVMMKRGN